MKKTLKDFTYFCNLDQQTFIDVSENYLSIRGGRITIENAVKTFCRDYIDSCNDFEIIEYVLQSNTRDQRRAFAQTDDSTPDTVLRNFVIESAIKGMYRQMSCDDMLIEMFIWSVLKQFGIDEIESDTMISLAYEINKNEYVNCAVDMIKETLKID